MNKCFVSLHRAIQASLALYRETTAGCTEEEARNLPTAEPEVENYNAFEGAAEQLQIALRLSEQQQIEEEQRRLLEEETFRQVLELSLTDK